MARSQPDPTAETENASTPAAFGTALLAVRNLVKEYRLAPGRKSKPFLAVDDISFDVEPGTTLGIVGESGSGKSTTAMIIAGLKSATSGQVMFNGKNITGLAAGDLRALRREIQVVFQDPHSSLDPRMTVGKAIDEPLYVHKYGPKAKRRDRVAELLELVGLHADYIDRHPHQLSGGQAQRVSIARALALEPKLVILDEPVSALDLSIQAQILNLLRRLQSELGLSYVFIGHDLAAVAYVSDRIAVMSKGKIVEQGDVDQVYSRPQDEYTKMLLAAILTPENDLGRLNDHERFSHTPTLSPT